MLSGLDGILFGRQTISVISHRMKHVEALQTLVSRINVTRYVTQRMAYMETGTRRIGKHVKHIEFLFRLVYFTSVGFIFAPALLPAAFYIFMIIFHLMIFNLF